MEVRSDGPGPPELHDADGWDYRLDGVGEIVTSYSVGFKGRISTEVTIYDLSDKTLDSIRVLRDSFPDHSIQLHHDY